MGNIPIKLIPAAKDYLWGGSRLNDDFNLNIEMDPLAEAWVCSTHADGECGVDSKDISGDVFGGQRLGDISDGVIGSGERSTDRRKFKLSDILSEHSDWLGSHPLSVTDNKPELPILIKLIDAKKDLSVQVHPDDDYAMRVEGELGKTEMWYVLDAKSDSELIYGFNRDVTPDEVRTALHDGSIGRFLNHVPVRKDDLFYIEAGTVHAIGAGCLIAEIQESSNLTYRLYDYDRVGKDGKKRQLHIDKALEVARLDSSAVPRQPMRVLKYRNGCAYELLARCKYFQVERMLLNTEVQRDLVSFRTGSNSFHALLCVDGCGSVSGEGLMMNFFKGDCIFVPADSIELKLHGRAQILDVSC